MTANGFRNETLTLNELSWMFDSSNNICVMQIPDQNQYAGVIEDQACILKQQKKRTLELAQQHNVLILNNESITCQIENLKGKSPGPELFLLVEQGWRQMEYISQLEEQLGATLSKLKTNHQVKKSGILSEENLTLGDFNLGEQCEDQPRVRNLSASSAEISTDNDQMSSSRVSLKQNRKKVINPMTISGIDMKKLRLEKYKIVQTFYDKKSSAISETNFSSPQDQLNSLMIQTILTRHHDVQEVRKRIIEQQVVIPHCQRSQLWPILIGTKYEIPSSYFSYLKLKSSQIDPLSKKLISADITRTFPQLHFFNSSKRLLQDLKQVLQMFQAFNSTVGYVQGMAHLASMLLLVFDCEKAFECFNNLVIGWPFIRNLYSFNQKDYQLKLGTMSMLINQYIPKLNRKISPCQQELLMIQWFFSIYSRNFDIEVSIRIWDVIFLNGEHMFYTIALAILRIFTHQILAVNEDEVYLTVKELTATLTFQQLSQSIHKLPLTNKQYTSVLSKVKG